MIPQGEDRRGWRVNLGGHPRVGRGGSFFGQNREREEEQDKAGSASQEQRGRVFRKV